MNPQFFIRRPRFALVISILITITFCFLFFILIIDKMHNASCI